MRGITPRRETVKLYSQVLRCDNATSSRQGQSIPDRVLLNSCSCDVFVLVRILMVTFHGHDHEERAPSPLSLFEQPANRFLSELLVVRRKIAGAITHRKYQSLDLLRGDQGGFERKYMARRHL